MPFTFAHPAIVLPLAKLNRKYISTTALITGSITPDLECFIRLKAKSIYSHTLWGILYFDIPIAVVLYLLWKSLLKGALLSNLPAFLQKRFDKTNTYRNRIVVIISLTIGILSHLLWDSFTHANGYFVRTLPALRQTYYVIWDSMLYGWLRNISGVLGMLIIILAISRQPTIHIVNVGNKLYWPIVAFFIFATLAIRCVVPHRILSIGDYFSTFVAGLIIGLIIASLLFRQRNISRQ